MARGTNVWYHDVTVIASVPTADHAAEQIGLELCELAAHVHAGMAQLARLAAEFDGAEGWQRYGARSFGQWLSINAGCDLRTGDELLRVGQSLTGLPAVAAAFAAGELSFDKVRAISRVATAADEDVWLELARQASGAQLTRICRGYRRAALADAPERAEAHLARRGLWTRWDEDGMLHLEAALPPEDGALVLAALEAVRDRSAAVPPSHEPAAPMTDPADDAAAARRADALASLCEQALRTAGDDAGMSPGAGVSGRLVVHVDVGVLTGEDPEGRCHLDGGPPLSAAAARRLGCDTEVVAVTERDGLPIDVGRARRIVPTRLRRAVQGRDRGCRFPGCGVPAHRTHAHHLQHWIDGGRTDLDNLVALCGFHHRRLHDGVYRIEAQPGGGMRFETTAGQPITPGPHAVGREGAAPSAAELHQRLGAGAEIDALTPLAGDAGAPCDMAYVVSAVADACADRRSRAGPSG
jgi:Domain of unknown function (DUF222)/HNH endonuclease